MTKGAREREQEGMAELHVVGRIVGGQDFDEDALFCKW